MTDHQEFLDRVIVAMQRQARNFHDEMTIDDIIRATVCDTATCYLRPDLLPLVELSVMEQTAPPQFNPATEESA